jgi:hypothetical protein
VLLSRRAGVLRIDMPWWSFGRTVSILVSLLVLAPACRRSSGGAAPAPARAAHLPFGAACSSDAECQSNACFIGTSASFCSIVCTQATAATDCPVPLTTGSCNKRGFCRKP